MTFQFIDATAIITKNALWQERDRAIADDLEKLDTSSDGKAVKSILRKEMVIVDKAYSEGSAWQAMRAKGCHSGAIKKQCC